MTANPSLPSKARSPPFSTFTVRRVTRSIAAIAPSPPSWPASRARSSRPISRAAALEFEDLRAIIARIDGEDVRALRDRALLLVAFFGALRRSELVALDVAVNNVRGRSSVEVRPEGLLVHLTGTKASAATQTVAIPRRADELCATAALERYLAAAGITNGPLFRAVSKAGRPLERRLEASSVRHILKQRASAGSVVLAALVALRLHHQCGGCQRARTHHPTYEPPQVGRDLARLHSRRRPVRLRRPPPLTFAWR